MEKKGTERILGILSKNTPGKAKMRTLQLIEEELGSLNTSISREDGGIDYEKVVKLLTILAQQDDLQVTEEMVRNNLDMGNLGEAVEAIAEAIKMEVPQALLDAAAEQLGMSDQEEEAEETEEADGPDLLDAAKN